MNRLLPLVLLMLLLAAAPPASAAGPAVQQADLVAETPNPYVVVPGDTLWGIAERFLHAPKRWPAVWDHNPQIKNPHRIFPGDTVYLTVDANGQPHLSVNVPGPGKLTVTKVGPRVHYAKVVRQDALFSQKQRATVEEFLRRQSLISESTPQNQGYIVAPVGHQHMVAQGDLVVLRFAEPVAVGQQLAVYREGSPLVHPVTKASHGFKINHLGLLSVERVVGEAIEARIIHSFAEMEAGDKVSTLQPINTEFPILDEAPEAMAGTILAMEVPHQNASHAYQVITVDLGRQERAMQGVVLTVWRAAKAVADPTDKKRPAVVPSQKIGTAILIYVGERASYALLTRTTEPVSVGDGLTAE